MIAGTLIRNAGGETFTLSVATILFDIAPLRVDPAPARVPALSFGHDHEHVVRWRP